MDVNIHKEYKTILYSLVLYEHIFRTAKQCVFLKKIIEKLFLKNILINFSSFLSYYLINYVLMSHPVSHARMSRTQLIHPNTTLKLK